MGGKQSQADAAACTLDKEEIITYAAAKQAARSMTESLAALQSEGKERQRAIPELKWTLQGLM